MVGQLVGEQIGFPFYKTKELAAPRRPMELDVLVINMIIIFIGAAFWSFNLHKISLQTLDVCWFVSLRRFADMTRLLCRSKDKKLDRDKLYNCTDNDTHNNRKTRGTNRITTHSLV